MQYRNYSSWKYYNQLSNGVGLTHRGAKTTIEQLILENLHTGASSFTAMPICQPHKNCNRTTEQRMFQQSIQNQNGTLKPIFNVSVLTLEENMIWNPLFLMQRNA